MRPINLLSSDISLLDTEAKFFDISGVHYIKFAMIIKTAMVIMAVMTVIASS